MENYLTEWWHWALSLVAVVWFAMLAYIPVAVFFLDLNVGKMRNTLLRIEKQTQGDEQ